MEIAALKVKQRPAILVIGNFLVFIKIDSLIL